MSVFILYKLRGFMWYFNGFVYKGIVAKCPKINDAVEARK